MASASAASLPPLAEPAAAAAASSAGAAASAAAASGGFSSIIRVKRKAQDDPAEALVLHSKRSHLVEGEAEAGVVLRRVGTVATADDIEGISMRQALLAKIHSLPVTDRTSKPNQGKQGTMLMTDPLPSTARQRVQAKRRNDIKGARLQLVTAAAAGSGSVDGDRKAGKRVADEDDDSDDITDDDEVDDGEDKTSLSQAAGKGADGSKAQKNTEKSGGASLHARRRFKVYDVIESASAQTSADILCNLVPMMQQKAQITSEEVKIPIPRDPEEPVTYVYDLYYLDGEYDRGDFSSGVFDIQSLKEDELVHDVAPESDAELYSDEDDENDEDNWRNDYPDEDEDDEYGDDDDDEYGMGRHEWNEFGGYSAPDEYDIDDY